MSPLPTRPREHTWHVFWTTCNFSKYRASTPLRFRHTCFFAICTLQSSVRNCTRRATTLSPFSEHCGAFLFREALSFPRSRHATIRRGALCLASTKAVPISRIWISEAVLCLSVVIHGSVILTNNTAHVFSRTHSSQCMRLPYEGRAIHCKINPLRVL